MYILHTPWWVIIIVILKHLEIWECEYWRFGKVSEGQQHNQILTQLINSLTFLLYAMHDNNFSQVYWVAKVCDFFSQKIGNSPASLLLICKKIKIWFKCLLDNYKFYGNLFLYTGRPICLLVFLVHNRYWLCCWNEDVCSFKWKISAILFSDCMTVQECTEHWFFFFLVYWWLVFTQVFGLLWSCSIIYFVNDFLYN